MNESQSLPLVSGLVAMLIGVGTAVQLEIVLCLLRRLVPLRRPPLAWWRWWLLPSACYLAAALWLIDPNGSTALLPSCVSVPLGLSASDGRFAVTLGISYGLSVRHLFGGDFYLSSFPVATRPLEGETPRSCDHVPQAAGSAERHR